jgi:polysaccharide deacetylase 2 family uncharacterized protein YibQ
LTVAYHGLDCVELAFRQRTAGLPPVQLPTMPGQTRGGEETSAARSPVTSVASLDSTEPGKGPSTPEPARKPRIAIIVDDGGYADTSTERILSLNQALTLSILPDCEATTSTARRARELGFEVMLHMPMETHSKKAKFPNAITTDMTEAQIRERTGRALAQVPGAAGVNNHTGSKFTSDEKSMRALLNYLKELSLYFVDSRTWHETVAYTLAQELGIQSAERDVFLDNDAEPAAIRNQFDELVTIAKQQGFAIGICHFRPRTADVLAEVLPELRKKGVEIVHVSEVVR